MSKKYDSTKLKLVISWKGHPINTWCYEIYYCLGFYEQRLEVFGNNYWGEGGFDQASKEGVDKMKEFFQKEI